MNKKDYVSLVLLSMFIGTLLVLLVGFITYTPTQLVHSSTGCCTVQVTEWVDDTYYVKWVDNTTSSGFTYTEITTREELAWTISEFKDFCWTHHIN